jgi:hypothetical protein
MLSTGRAGVRRLYNRCWLVPRCALRVARPLCWRAPLLCSVQNRMNKLESLRLEVDSRRRTVARLGKKVGQGWCGVAGPAALQATLQAGRSNVQGAVWLA